MQEERDSIRPKFSSATGVEELVIVACVDARGLRCPMPLLKFKQALARADIGACVSLLATDAGAARDLPAYARLSGHELLQQTVDEAGVLKFVIRKHG